MNRYCLAAALLFWPVLSWAQAAIEPDYRLLHRIAACTTVRCVISSEAKGRGHVARTVLYAKWMLLDSSNRTAAKGLLENLPESSAEFVALMTLPDWHEGATTSDAEMGALASIYENWPKLLASAVRRWPNFLPAYIRLGQLAINDPHSDFTTHERGVCRANRNRFIAGFHKLSREEQRDTRRYVFDPYNCMPIFVGEAE